jgi:hypothetical protein
MPAVLAHSARRRANPQGRGTMCGARRGVLPALLVAQRHVYRFAEAEPNAKLLGKSLE